MLGGCSTNVNNQFTNIEIHCMDAAIHQARILARKGKPDSWQKVILREYQSWDEDIIRVETAHASVDQSSSELLDKLGKISI